jgi:Zn-dependent protease with chaperone function
MLRRIAIARPGVYLKGNSPVGRLSYATYRRFQQDAPHVNWNRQLQWMGAMTVLGGIFYVSHLEAAPYSNRRRFMLIWPEIEKYIGDRGYEETMAQFRHYILPDNHPETLRVKKVMKPIIKASGLDHLDWQIHVINDPKSPPNAFVLPGGKVFVFSSILPICGNDDGLATVLSHETAHQVARHTAENLSKAPFYLALGLVLYTITGSSALNRLLINGLLQLPASREMEREADYVGLMMMSKACFNPGEAVHLWERMARFEESMSKRSFGRGTIPEFLSTHPSSENRIGFIRQRLGEAYAVKEQAGCDNYSGFLSGFRDFSGNHDERGRW